MNQATKGGGRSRALDILDEHLSDDGTRRYFDVRSTTGRPLTVNKVTGLHRQQWATLTREIRGEWWALALEAKIPKLMRARVIVLPLHRDNCSPQDVGACAPHVKAALDGLVDAGVLPDDNPVHVLSHLYLPPLVCGHDGLHLRLEEA